jgi:LysW-gamma-L-lysine carboxypeptidase
MDRQRAVALIRGLVAIPSLSHHEAAAAAWLVEQMRDAGYERAFVDDAGNAVGEIGAADAARTLVLLGHIDTVPGNIPVRIEPSADGELLYGRGSVDAKGPLATFAAAGARLSAAWARERGIRVIVVGAVEEEAATSKGARFIAARFNGSREPIPDACIIGEPSHWHRITLGYKGRLLLDLEARQPMAHTAGPGASVAAIVVDLWNWVSMHAAATNQGRDKAFDQLSPSLRRFITSTTADMIDTVDAQIAWRLPIGVDPEALVAELLKWTAEHIEAPSPPVGDIHGPEAAGLKPGPTTAVVGARTRIDFRFRGFEQPWRSDRQNGLVRSFLASIRAVDASVQPGFVLKTGTSDMNVVAPIWRCPIVAYGPGDSALDHTPHEHVSLDEYCRAIDVVEGAIRNLAQT